MLWCIFIVECGITHFLCAMHVFKVWASSSSPVPNFVSFAASIAEPNPCRKIAHSINHSPSLLGNQSFCFRIILNILFIHLLLIYSDKKCTYAPSSFQTHTLSTDELKILMNFASGLVSEISRTSLDIVDTEKSDLAWASCTRLRAPVSVTSSSTRFRLRADSLTLRPGVSIVEILNLSYQNHSRTINQPATNWLANQLDF